MRNPPGRMTGPASSRIIGLSSTGSGRDLGSAAMREAGAY